jgi:hypothetical protein
MHRALWTLAMLLAPRLAAGQDTQLERAVRNVYGNVLIAKAAQHRYDARTPAAAASNDSALTAWLLMAGIPALERVGRAQYPNAMAGAEADVRRLQGVVNLTLRMAESRYPTLADFLQRSLTWTKYEPDLVRLRSVMGGAAAPTPAPTSSTTQSAGPPPSTGELPKTSAGTPPVVGTGAAQSTTATRPAIEASRPTVSSAAVEGVYLRRIVSTGYGGMMVFAYEPFLAYIDGSVFLEPSMAPETVDRARSRAAIPYAWGEVVRRTGNSWQLRMLGTRRAGDALERELKGVYRLTPGLAGQSLAGDFRSLGGTGNLATGGSAAVVVEDRWSFLPDGRFARGGFAGSSNSGVTTGASRPSRTGRYRIDGYAIELTFDEGTTERLIFGLDDSGGLVSIGGTVYTRKKR